MIVTLLKALLTFAISFVMGMIGFFLGAVIFVGVNKWLLALEEDVPFVAGALGFLCLYGAAIVGGIFGLQKGARWTGLMEKFDD